MYAEQNGGLTLNYGFEELGLNPRMLEILKAKRMRLLTASDAHRRRKILGLISGN